MPVMTTRRSRVLRARATSSVCTSSLSIGLRMDVAVQMGRLLDRHQRLGRVQRERELRGRDELLAAERPPLDGRPGRVLARDLDLEPELVAWEDEVTEAEPVIGADDPDAAKLAALPHHPV